MTARIRRSGEPSSRRLTVLGIAGLLAVAAIGLVSYTALGGLPWERNYAVSVEVPNANRLVGASEDVRIAGIRVGRVATVDVGIADDGRPLARIDLELDRSLEPLPADTRARVRPASVLGSTYVELTPGSSDTPLADGDPLPLRRPDREQTELTDLFEVFDREATRNFRSATSDLAGGLAGRGRALNEVIGSTDALLPPLSALSRTLSSPRTRLGEFITAYNEFSAALAPASAELGGLVAGGSTTFGALAAERDALGGVIEAAPGAESATTSAFARARPALSRLAALVADLEPAGRALPEGLREFDRAVRAGIVPLEQVPSLAERLESAFDSLAALGRDPATDGSIRKLAELTDASQGIVSAIGPAQLHCNSLALGFQNLGRTIATMGVGDGPTWLVAGLSEMGASGEQNQSATPAPTLATNFYPNQNARECEAGNEPFTGEQALGNPPGLQSTETRDTSPPPGTRRLAREGGLLDPIEGRP